LVLCVILQTIKRKKANWIGHNVRRNCLLKHVTEGKIAETRRQGRRHKQLLDDLKETRIYQKLEVGALDLGELTVYGATELLQDRVQSEWCAVLQ
jgi:hypothetical protein